jgi:hypothetical protein
MLGTVPARDVQFKHLFERVAFLSGRRGKTSYRRSIECLFDAGEMQEGVPMTAMTIHQQAMSPIRLTRRGRIVVVLTFLGGLMFGGFTLGHAPSEASGRMHPVAPRTVTVQAGDTLWTVAERVAPHMDPRLVVAQIQAANHLHSPQLLAGMQLVVPRS